MIFITGSESFVGTNLIRRLKKEKIKFIGIDTKKTSKNSNLKIRNINDPNLYKLIPKNSTIVHLAAISNVKDCESNPMKTLKTNINGTLNLIEQSVKKKQDTLFLLPLNGSIQMKKKFLMKILQFKLKNLITIIQFQN